MTCGAMGGPADCAAVLHGNTAAIKKMTPEEMAKWMAEFKPKFDALPG